MLPLGFMALGSCRFGVRVPVDLRFMALRVTPHHIALLVMSRLQVKVFLWLLG